MRNKIGVIFAISVMTLAGIGVSWAGFTSTITAYGTVQTATVTHTIGPDFSGTWVYKVYGSGQPDHEIYIDHDNIGFYNVQYMFPACTVIGPIASATASAGTSYDVNMVWNNIFPCIPFSCDFWFTYTGSIPVKISALSIQYGPNSEWVDQYITYSLQNAAGTPIGLGYQLHTGETVHVTVTIHLLQVNTLQGLSATGVASLTLIQWNEYP